jgi:hypothetical protein
LEQKPKLFSKVFRRSVGTRGCVRRVSALEAEKKTRRGNACAKGCVATQRDLKSFRKRALKLFSRRPTVEQKKVSNQNFEKQNEHLIKGLQSLTSFRILFGRATKKKSSKFLFVFAARAKVVVQVIAGLIFLARFRRRPRRGRARR